MKKAEREMTIPSQNFRRITSEVSHPRAFRIPVSRLSSILNPEALSQAKMMKASKAPKRTTSINPPRQLKMDPYVLSSSSFRMIRVSGKSAAIFSAMMTLSLGFPTWRIRSVAWLRVTQIAFENPAQKSRSDPRKRAPTWRETCLEVSG